MRPLNHFHVTSPPLTPDSIGDVGYIAVDTEYLYVYVDGRWKRTALSTVQQLPRMIHPTSTEYYNTHDESYFYIFFQRLWRTFALSIMNVLTRITQPYGSYEHLAQSRLVPAPLTKDTWGQDGYIAYDKEYFYVYIQKTWHKTAISDYTPGKINIPA